METNLTRGDVVKSCVEVRSIILQVRYHERVCGMCNMFVGLLRLLVNVCMDHCGVRVKIILYPSTRDGTRRVLVRVEPPHTLNRRPDLTRHVYSYTTRKRLIARLIFCGAPLIGAPPNYFGGAPGHMRHRN